MSPPHIGSHAGPRATALLELSHVWQAVRFAMLAVQFVKEWQIDLFRDEPSSTGRADTVS